MVDKKKTAKTAAVKKLTVEDLIAQAAQRNRAKKFPDLHTHQAPLGYHLRGVSTLLDRDGNVSQTWVKTQKSIEDPQAILDTFQIAVAGRNIAAAPRIAQVSKDYNKDLLTVTAIGDNHTGMLSWKEETGDDSDLKIAEANFLTAIDRLVSLSPPSETALIVNLGDFFHADNPEARTARSNNALDVDSRWAKVLRIGILMMTQAIDRSLEKHKKVRVINEIGNHDTNSSIMLSLCLSHYYRLNPRVEIDISPSKFHWFEFGKVLIATTHGDSVKKDKLPGIMAHDQAEAWGRTKYRHWMVGHVHHSSLLEFPGVTVETFRTLAAKDAWHAASGYRSARSMCCDVYHRERGRILRHEVGIEEVEDIQRNNL